MIRAELALLFVIALPLSAADAVSKDAATVAHQVVRDGVDLATAPRRWHRSEWMRFAEGSAAVVAAYVADDRMVRFVSRQQNQALNSYLRGVTHLGGGYGLDLAAVLAAGGYLEGNDRMMDAGLDALESSFAAAGVVTPAVKAAVGRARPVNGLGKSSFHPLDASYQSFPSGHATNAFAIASAIATRYDDNRFIPALAYGLAGSVAVARVHDRVHFASDVLAGAMIGRAIGKSIVWNHRRARVAFVPGLNGVSVRSEF